MSVGRVVFGTRTDNGTPTGREFAAATGSYTRYKIAVAIDQELDHLRAENAELRRQVAELIGRLAAMEAAQA